MFCNVLFIMYFNYKVTYCNYKVNTSTWWRQLTCLCEQCRPRPVQTISNKDHAQCRQHPVQTTPSADYAQPSHAVNCSFFSQWIFSKHPMTLPPPPPPPIKDGLIQFSKISDKFWKKHPLWKMIFPGPSKLEGVFSILGYQN